MKHTVYGRTGRAQLVVEDYTGPHIPPRRRKERPEFAVYLLPNSANRNTSFAAAGDPAYHGTDLEKALVHIKAWTSLEEVPLPREIRRYLEMEQTTNSPAAQPV